MKFLPAICILLSAALAEGAGQATALRCESQVAPFGIDQAAPALSWQIQDPRRGARQTAWQVLAASTPELLGENRGDLWDSGKVDSGQSHLVAYRGKPPVSRQRVYWKVRVWDQDGKAGPWSDPTWWEMGLLEPEDWQGAQWIASPQPHDAPDPVRPGEVGDWIWAADGANAPLEFRKIFTLPQKAIVRADVVANSDSPETLLQVAVNGLVPRGNALNGPSREVPNRAAEFDATTWLKPGAENEVAIQTTKAGAQAAVCFGLSIVYGDGTTELIRSDGTWQCRPFDPKSLPKRMPDERLAEATSSADWRAAAVLENYGDAKFGAFNHRAPQALPPALLRKDFTVTKEVSDARVWVCGIGYHELYLNGGKIGDRVLDPPQSNYGRYAFYTTYDVTPYLRAGGNALGVHLADGWYDQNLAWGTHMSYGKPGAIVLMRVKYKDGSEEIVKSDASWKAGEGALRAANIYRGEVYDARREAAGWSEPGTSVSNWPSAVVLPPLSPALKPNAIAPMRKVREIKPVKISSPLPGAWVVDMGENITGWMRLRMKGLPAGKTVRLRFGEWLNPDGSIDMLSTGPLAHGLIQRDEYVSKGGDVEIYEPRFTYHAFQYVEISGLDRAPAPEDVTAVVVHTDLPSAGEFECSEPLLNTISEMFRRTLLNGFHGHFEDCPHRERCEWGHMSVCARAALYYLDSQDILRKFADDFMSRPAADGAPLVVGVGKRTITDPARPSDADVPSGNAPFEVMAYLAEIHGDDRALRKYDAEMNLWLANLQRRMDKDGIISKGTNYGDHAAIPHARQADSRDFVATCFALYAARIAIKQALLLEKADEARGHEALAEKIRRGLIKRFYKPERKTFGSQSADTLALHFDLVPEDRAAIARSLADDVRGRGHWLVGGMVSYPKIGDALGGAGFGEDAIKGLLNTKREGIGWTAANGYTTVWEVYHPFGTFQERKVSKNHANFGGIGSWFFEGILGIRPDPAQPGFQHIILRPEATNTMAWARGSYRSPYGVIRSDWRREQGKFVWRVTVPPNTRATAYVPRTPGTEVTESGRPLAGIAGFRAAADAGDVLRVELDAGEYVFEAR